jgi:hypothetical protein
MSLLLDRVLSEIEQLSLAEQMQVLEHLVQQMKQSIPVPVKPKKQSISV